MPAQPRVMSECLKLCQDPERHASAHAVWLQCRPMVHATIRRNLPYIGGSEYWDAVADLEARLWELALTFDPSRGFKPATYLTLALRHAAWRWAEVRNRHGVTKLYQDGNGRLFPSVDIYSLDKEYASGQSLLDSVVAENTEGFSDCDRQEVRELLKCLPERERRYIEMYYFEHLTMHQIGAAVGRSRQSVGQAISRNLRRLRIKLTGSEQIQKDEGENAND